MASFQSSNKRILAIDGGGFRGLGCLLVIQGIMKEVEQRSRRSMVPCEVFDLICGSSTGGIIAILLGRLGLDCPTAINIYKSLAISLFGQDESTFWGKLIDSSSFQEKTYENNISQFVLRYTGYADDLVIPAQKEQEQNARKSTKTFVTVTSDAPGFCNRTYHIRSYQLSTHITAPPPSDHKWLIREAVRATSASQAYISPMLVQNQIEFRDASFSGFNNPSGLASRETGRLWETEKVGAVISIGTGFSSLVPEKANYGWGVTDKYAKKFADEMISLLPSASVVGDVSRERVMALSKQLVYMALDTEVTHVDMFSRFSDDIYHRVNPPLGLANMELVDCFHMTTVEETVTDWIKSPEGKKRISDIASILVESAPGPLTIEQARKTVPPPPPPDTNPGYNLQLDKKRPDTMIEYLSHYHVFFVVDDSASMRAETRWPETRDALVGIAQYAIDSDMAQIDLRFFNNKEFHSEIEDASTIASIFDSMRPSGHTPTGATLKQILDEHLNKLDKAVNTPAYRSIKPLDVIVITDGKPDDNPKDVLIDTASHLAKSKHHPNCIGIQFVQIGHAEGAEEALLDLTRGDVGNMVDTVPYTESLGPKTLERILLGALHPNIRAMLNS